jgi:apolipoprotein N-acyltransferase
LKELTVGKIVRRGLLYFGLAIGALTAFALVFAILIHTGHTGVVPHSWIALVVFTAGLFWVTIRQSRGYWNRPNFWLTIAGFLLVHLFALAAILRAYPQWRGIWFAPVVIVEGGLFGAVLYLLFGERKNR